MCWCLRRTSLITITIRNQFECVQTDWERERDYTVWEWDQPTDQITHQTIPSLETSLVLFLIFPTRCISKQIGWRARKRYWRGGSPPSLPLVPPSLSRRIKRWFYNQTKHLLWTNYLSLSTRQRNKVIEAHLRLSCAVIYEILRDLSLNWFFLLVITGNFETLSEGGKMDDHNDEVIETEKTTAMERPIRLFPDRPRLESITEDEGIFFHVPISPSVRLINNCVPVIEKLILICIYSGESSFARCFSRVHRFTVNFVTRKLLHCSQCRYTSTSKKILFKSVFIDLVKPLFAEHHEAIE